MGYQARNDGGPFEFVCDAEADLATIVNPRVGQFALALSEGTIHYHTGSAWSELGGAGSGAPDDADYLVGTTNAGLSAEIVVGATPGGELGGTWGTPTVDATHAGSTHAAATDTHIADTSAAHAASAVSADSTTLVGVGTDVQAVLEELDNGVADHLADTSAAHAASAVSFSPNGSIAATDVQAAIQEVRDEAGGAVATDAIWDAAGDLAQGTGANTAARIARGTALTDRLVVVGTSLAWTPHIIRRTAASAARNSGNSGTTLTADDTLLHTVAANETWWFELILIITAANATMDFKCDWTAPAGATMQWGAAGTPNNNIYGFGPPVAAATSLGIAGSGTVISVGTLAGTEGANFQGLMICGATPGDFTFRWAQNTSDAGDLVLAANSHLRLTRFA